MLRTVVRKLGFDVVRHRPGWYPTFWPEPSMQMSVLELAVRAQLSESFYFVQIGAHDGVEADLLRPLILKFGLRGLLVEPLPDVFERLKANYAGRDLSFENCAITPLDGTIPFYRPIEGTATQGMASMSEAKVRAVGSGVERIEVAGLTLQSLLRKHHIERVSLLYVDAEGFDFEIIRMALDCDVVPALIYFEITGRTTAECNDVCRLLNEHGYRITGGHSDLLAVRDSA